MLGDEKELDSGDMFHVFNVDELIPPNHLLRRLDAVLDTSWVRKEVADCYSDRGRPSWDPEVIIRMILLGYLHDLSEVRLVDELRMHMGYRWFCRLQPSNPVPDRTTLVKIRNEKWKSDIWRKFQEHSWLSSEPPASPPGGTQDRGGKGVPRPPSSSASRPRQGRSPGQDHRRRDEPEAAREARFPPRGRNRSSDGLHRRPALPPPIPRRAYAGSSATPDLQNQPSIGLRNRPFFTGLLGCQLSNSVIY